MNLAWWYGHIIHLPLKLLIAYSTLPLRVCVTQFVHATLMKRTFVLKLLYLLIVRILSNTLLWNKTICRPNCYYYIMAILLGFSKKCYTCSCSEPMLAKMWIFAQLLLIFMTSSFALYCGEEISRYRWETLYINIQVMWRSDPGCKKDEEKVDLSDDLFKASTMS